MTVWFACWQAGAPGWVSSPKYGVQLARRLSSFGRVSALAARVTTPAVLRQPLQAAYSAAAAAAMQKRRLAAAAACPEALSRASKRRRTMVALAVTLARFLVSW